MKEEISEIMKGEGKDLRCTLRGGEEKETLVPV